MYSWGLFDSDWDLVVTRGGYASPEVALRAAKRGLQLHHVHPFWIEVWNVEGEVVATLGVEPEEEDSEVVSEGLLDEAGLNRVERRRLARVVYTILKREGSNV